jgi:hypothetical protein
MANEDGHLPDRPLCQLLLRPTLAAGSAKGEGRNPRPNESRLPRRPSCPQGRSFQATPGHLDFREWEIQDAETWSSGLLLSTHEGRDPFEIWIPWEHRIYNLRETLASKFQAGGIRPLHEFTIHLQLGSPPLACLLPVSYLEEHSAMGRDKWNILQVHYEAHLCRCNSPYSANAAATVDCGRPCWACAKHLEQRTPGDSAAWQAPANHPQHMINLCCASTRACWHKDVLDNSQTGGIYGPHDHLFCFDQISLSTGELRHFHFNRELTKAQKEMPDKLEDSRALAVSHGSLPSLNSTPGPPRTSIMSLKRRAPPFLTRMELC